MSEETYIFLPSFAQQRLWFLDQFTPGTTAYNLPSAVRLSGPLDAAALERSLGEIMWRHEATRTTFAMVDGQLVQLVAPASEETRLPLIDLRALPPQEREAEVMRLAQEDARRPFDLQIGPLLRATLLRLQEHEHVLLLTMHHIVSDGWSMSVLVRELVALYGAFAAGQPSPLADLPIQYADFAAWQREWLGENDADSPLARQLAYWRQQLADPPVLDLATDRPRPAVQELTGARYHFTLPRPLTDELRALSQREGATLFMTLLAAFNVLLQRYSDQSDIVVGTPIAGRTQAELEGLIGLFVNTLALRTDLGGDPTFRDLLQRVRETALQAYAHQDVPFELLVDALQPERDMSRNPLFQVMFVLQNAPPVTLQAQGLSLRSIAVERDTAMFDLSLALEEVESGLRGNLEYSTDLFDAATITRMVAQFEHVLKQIVADPAQPIAALALLTTAERERLLNELSTTSADSVALGAQQCVHQRFEMQVAQRPDAVAVSDGAHTLTYRELDERANQLAHHLRMCGVGPDRCVGLCVERSLDLAVGLLGILKAGGAYLPLDPSSPPERLQFMLDDARVVALVTQQPVCRRTGLQHAQTIRLDADWSVIVQQPPTRPDSAVVADNLAYVIYTSGSTGQPKGVMVTHGALVNHNLAVIKRYELQPVDRVLQFATPSFDVAAEECFPSWACGAQVVLCPDDLRTALGELLAFVQAQQITVLNLPTPVWHEWATLAHDLLPVPASVRLVIVGSEAARPDRLATWRRAVGDRVRWLNGYGPTEATITATVYDWSPDHAARASVPIGRPLANVETYVLDARMEPTPIGVPGDLYIGGLSLARGYLGRPALTAERFVPHPFASGARLYKTGDRARYLLDGTIEFLGRVDYQVKLRGFRIELGEIESVLQQHPAVREAVVMLREDRAHERRLVAYVVAQEPRTKNQEPGDANGATREQQNKGTTEQGNNGAHRPNHQEPGDEAVGSQFSVLSSSQLRAFLQERVPEYMIPAAFVVLDALPLTANGKIDRRALPAPDQGAVRTEHALVAPRTAAERTLAEIWAAVLGVREVGIHDQFFALGGDSILAIQVIARAHQAGLHLTPRHLFQHPTIAELAAVADTALPVAAEQDAVTGPVPLTPIQHWFFEQQVAELQHYNQALLLELRQRIEPALLEQAIRHLLLQHDALRLRFRLDAAGVQQHNAAPDEDVPLSLIDLTGRPASEVEAAIVAAAAELQASLDLRDGPLLRVALFDLGADQPGRLLLLIHHLAVDGVSWRILLEDLQTIYGQLAEDRAAQEAGPRLPAKTTSFKQWAERLVAYAQSPALAHEARYWLATDRPAIAPLPLDNAAGDNTVAAARTVTLRLSADETDALLHEAPAAYRTQINDVLLTALAQGFAQWTGSARLLLDLEGHGREDLFDDVDLSRTVGWFTTIYPVLLDISAAAGPGLALRTIKEQLRQIPQRGIGYGLLRYLGTDAELRERLRGLPAAEISFNYLGQVGQTLPADGLFAPARERIDSSYSPLGRRSYRLEINAIVSGGQLHLTWIYSEQVHHRATIERLAQAVMRALSTLIAHCRSPLAGGYTPSDFPLATLDQALIDRLFGADREIEDVYPLSPTQQGILFHTLYTPESGMYIEQVQCVIQGRLDPAAFAQSWQYVIDRHPILRSAVLWQELAEPIQVVRRHVSMPWNEQDWREIAPETRDAQLAAYVVADRAQGFDLARAPLMRLALFRVADEATQIVWSCHHLLLDGWSLPLVLNEVMRAYLAFSQEQAADLRLEQPRPYRDYIAWLRRQNLAEAELFWRDTLRGFSAPTPLAVDTAVRGAERGAGFGELRHDLDEPTTSALQALARSHGLTLNTLVQGAWAVLLSRYSGEASVVFGATVSGRPPDLVGVESMVGLFINTLPVRVAVAPDAPLLDWLQSLQQQQAELRQFEYSPLVQVQSWSDVPRGVALFESIVVFENYPVVAASTEGDGPRLAIQNVRSVEQTNYPLTLIVVPGATLTLRLSYDRRRFDDATIGRMLGHVQVVLRAIAADAVAEPRLAELPLLRADERRSLLALGAPRAAYSHDRFIHEQIADHAARTPDAVALVYEDERLSYAALNRRANQVAHQLQALGVGPEVRVGVCLERSLDLVVALLAVLKAGGAYVPLDPAYPAARLQFLLRDAAMPVLITQHDLRERVSSPADQPGPQVICLDRDWPTIAEQRSDDPRSAVTPDNLAYVIYTSGSTGQPKGVEVTHRNVARLLAATDDWFHFGADDVWTLFHSASFDFSVWELWGALCYGGRLVVVPYLVSRAPDAFYRLLIAERVTVLNQTPSAFRQLIAAEAQTEQAADLALRLVIFGGEALELPSLQPWFARHGDQRPQLVNMYGITETTVHVTYRPITSADVEQGLGSVIGPAIPDLHLYVLDAQMEPTPIGVAGELYVGGAGVARGYLNQAALTATRFVPHPFTADPGARLYRSGDLARRLPDGDLEYLGRADQQVKIRGFRIELGEIEAALEQHALVRQAVVLPRADEHGAHYLAAYLVPDADPPTVGELRRFLLARLPEHMLPATFVLLPALPLTEHGKIDRRALRENSAALEATEQRLAQETTFVAPGNAAEEVLAAIWSQVLGVAEVGVEDNFFALGGDSIRSIQILGRARERGLDLTLPQLFEHQTIRALAHELGAGSLDASPLSDGQPFSLISAADRARVPQDVEDAYPLTMLQAGMLFHSEFRPEHAVYHDVNTLYLQAHFDPAALRAALAELATRHAILRTSFDLTSYSEPLQVVHAQAEIPLTIADLRDLQPEQQKAALADWFEGEKQRPFDWSRAPLIRFQIHRRSADSFQLSWSEHHAILDGWSVASMLTELFQHYVYHTEQSVPPLAPPPTSTFRDFVALERAALADPATQQYWSRTLSDATLTKLPRSSASAPAASAAALALDVPIAPDLSDRLKQLARTAAVPLKSVLLAAHLRVMALLGGSNDVLTGLVSNGRPETTDGERVLGLFLNTLPFRRQLDGGSWLDLVQATFAAEQELLRYRRYPLAQAQRMNGGQPLFETAFNFTHFHVYKRLGEVKGVTVIGGSGFEQTNFALMTNFSLDVATDQVRLTLNCDPAVVDGALAAAMGGYYANVLAAMTERARSRYDRAALLPADEQRQVLRDWNATATTYDAAHSLHELVEAQAVRTPDATALVFEDERLSYAALNRRANQLAHHLRALGVGPDVLVGVCVERSVELVVALLAVLKAGGAYVPLDPSYPAERLQFMLQDAAMPVLLTQAHLRERVSSPADQPGPQVICLDRDWPAIAEHPASNPAIALAPDNLAYMIYTSGSTGQPKGALNTHGAIVNRLLWMQQRYTLTPADRVLQKTPASFDVSVWEFFWPLITGARLVLARPEGHKDPAYLVSLIAAQEITTLHFVPSMLQVFLQERDLGGCASLKRVICSGEALPYELQQRFFERVDAELHNLYGPTEAAVDVSFWACQRDSGERSVPIGRPVANTQLYVLDAQMQPSPVGVAGDLYIGGVQLARGYHRRPALTAERFVPDPFGGPGARLYRTGDRACWRTDGAILYLGRDDGQVKLRGQRIELGEIEAVLNQHPAIQAAAVLPYTDERRGDTLLVAYVVEEPRTKNQEPEGGNNGAKEQGNKGAREQTNTDEEQVRAVLRARLPEYMVPSAFVWLPALPLTPNGKLDRKALPAPELTDRQQVFVAPRTPQEEVIAQIWADVLQIERVGAHDQFFALGGHSLLATQIVSRLRDVFQTDLPLRVLFESPTVAGLAEQITALRAAAHGQTIPTLRPVPRTEPLPLSFAQRRLWFLDQLQPGNPFYNMHTAVRLSGPLNVAAVEQSLNTIVARHETLRTTFVLDASSGADEPVQVIAPALAVPLPLLDLRELPAVERDAAALRLALAESDQSFDIQRGPLLRTTLLRLDDDQHVLLLTMHHIVSDGWSMGVLIQELAALYAAYSRDRDAEVVLSPLAIQYGDWAVWQREWLAPGVPGGALDRQLRYWKQQLADLPVLDLPTDRPRPAVPSFQGATTTFALPQALTDALHALSRREGVTLFMTLLAGFQSLLARWSGQSDIVVGSPIANRTRAEIEPLIGFFVNMLVLRTDLGDAPSVRELLRRVRETALSAYSHQDLPFEHLVEQLQPDRNLSINPLFQVGFALQNTPLVTDAARLELSGLTLSQMRVAGATAKFDLSLFMHEGANGLTGLLEYNTDLFDVATVERLLGHFQVLLHGMAAASEAQPTLPVAALLLVGEDERQHLRRFERSDEPILAANEQFVHHLFAAQAACTPDAVALICEQQRISFRELDRRANQVAHQLRAMGVGRDVLVGLCVERSIELVIGLLAVLKAGGAYVPLDPTYPPDRLEFMIADAQVRLLVTQQHLREHLPSAQQADQQVVCLDRDWSTIALQPDAAPVIEQRPTDLAYVIYTSGSTGQPKGVLVEHQQLAHTLRVSQATFGFTAADRMPSIASFSFDIALFELFCALLAGGSVELLTRDQVLDLPRFADTIAEMTALHTLPSLMRQLAQFIHDSGLSARYDRLRQVFVGGDAVAPDLLTLMQAAFPQARIDVLYGPTEATIICASYAVPRGQLHSKHLLGRPLSDTALRLYDEHGQLAPIGLPGELYIGGAGVTRGYLHRAELTAEKFVLIDGERWYRSGDLGRWLPDGTIEFLGRLDQQVKLRGFRVELGEIEATLRQHAAVHDAVVVARDELAGPSDRRLVAYVVPRAAGDEQALETVQMLPSAQVAEWRQVFDAAYDESSPQHDPLFNISGWNSSYTGEPIPAEQMRAWVDQTVERITALKPRRVLEIGCGTGLLLWRIAPECERYCGTDFSAATLRALEQQVRRRGLDQVTLLERTADDFSGLDAAQFDLVIINSVVQYFPSMAYLLRVLEGAAQMVAPGGTIFVGDVRSLPLLAAFHASVELYQAPDTLPLSELQQHVRAQIAGEQELVIDPAFFTALGQHLPQISAVQVQPKRGRFANEVIKFRYDVLLHCGRAAQPDGALPWLDWRQSALTLSALRRMISQDAPDLLGLVGIPNARLVQEQQTLERLAQADGATTADTLRATIEADRAEIGASAIDPEDIWALAAELPYEVELSWADAAEDGAFAALFRRRTSAPTLLPAAPPVAAADSRPWASYANQPLQAKIAREIVPLLRSDLQARLPDYMVPAAFVVLPALPLTANGKLDRAALPAPSADEVQSRAVLEQAYVAPRTAVEARLAAIWSELLGVAQVGVEDNFFALGGHSLLATQLVSRVRAALAVELPLRALFEAPTVAALAARIAATTPSAARPPIRALPREQALPLSFAQQRLWFLDQLQPDSAVYLISAAVRLLGELDLAALADSLTAIVARHETLRTTFALSADAGEPIQVIAPPPRARLALPLHDLSALPPTERAAEVQRRALAEAQQPFDLQCGPLLRVEVLRLDDDQHVVLLTMHHIISDGWSMGVFIRELGALYTAAVAGQRAELPTLPVQYADYAIWQRAWLAPDAPGGALAQQLGYWRQQLAELPVLQLPTDYPRQALPSHRGASHDFVLEPELTAALNTLSQQAGVTLFMTLLAAFQIVLQRSTGQDDIIVGSPIANRTQDETEALIGFFVNTLVLRGDLSGNPRFRDLLQQVRETCLQAYAHQDLPFEQVVEAVQPERDLSRNPLFQVMFVLQNTPVERLELPRLTLEPLPVDRGITPFDLNLSLGETARGLVGTLEYSADLFAPATIERLVAQLATLLRGIVATPDARIAALPLLSAAERALLDRYASTPREPQSESQQCIHTLFEAQAARTPDALALIFDDQRLSYHELNTRADQVARYLQRRGVQPDMFVGLFMERSAELIIGMLGVLKAGAAYVPLDPAYPPERVQFMLHDARLPIVLTQARLRSIVPACDAELVCLDSDWPHIAAPVSPAAALPAPSVTPDHLAYVIYTSGSTGVPKGVMAHHRGLVNFTLWMTEQIGLQPAQRFLQFASVSFDASAVQIFPTLISGATLVLHPEPTRLSNKELLDLCVRHEITVIDFPAAFLQQWIADLAAHGERLPATVRVCMTGGESTSLEHLRAWAGLSDHPVRFLSSYGPTEATVTTTLFATGNDEVERLPWPSVPLGARLANTQVLLLDRQMALVPVGVAGEVYIGGAGLVRGYLNAPALTAERFVPHPFASSPGARLYRTGDLARVRADGSLEFLGRIDQQVKIRGFRIELGEIEAALNEHPQVREVVVLALTDRSAEGHGTKRLVAYVVEEPRTKDQEPGREPRTKNQEPGGGNNGAKEQGNNGDEVLGSQFSVLGAADLRAFLQQRLPEYMVPSAFVVLPALPLTANSKVDRQALADLFTPGDLSPRAALEQAYVAPRTAVEARLAAIWSELLGVAQVGVEDNFFALGGHSLLATQLVSRVRAALAVELPLRALFEAPTVAALAARIAATTPSATRPPIRALPREQALPLSFAQQRLWFIDQLQPGNLAYNMLSALQLRGTLNLDALADSLTAIVARHETLRTTFALSTTEAGEPIQVIAPPPRARLVLPLHDLRALPPTERAAEGQRRALAEAQQPFDLGCGPLLRVEVLRLAHDEHVVLFNMHHIVSDGWSMGVLVRELGALYAAAVADRTVELPALPVQYADYAVWQRAWLAPDAPGGALAQQLGYWKQQLAELPVLQLPTDRPRPAVLSHRGASHDFMLEPELSAALNTLSQREGVTLFMTLLAAFQVMLQRYSRQDDLAIGTDVANRTEGETESLIGFFVNQLVLRGDLSGNPRFTELLQQARETCLQAYAHQDLPFEYLVKELNPERSLNHSPLFQVKLILQNTGMTALDLPGLTIEPLSSTVRMAKFDLLLALAESDQGLIGTLEYSADLFDAPTIERMAAQFATLLRSVVATPDARIGDLALLPDLEHLLLLGLAAPTSVDLFARVGQPSIHALFEAQAARTPDAVAVTYGAQHMRYAELNSRANQLAHYLRELGVGRHTAGEECVALCMERSIELVVAIVAILKAGAAYVPLDPAYPPERLQFMLNDSAAEVVLTQRELSATLGLDQTSTARIVCVDDEWPQIAACSSANLDRAVQPDQIAYVIYTSGSTGRPKGVPVTHRNVMRLFAATDEWFQFGADDVWTLFHSYAFDFSVWELWGALLHGGRLVVVPYLVSRAPDQFYALLREERVTVLNQTPSAFRQLIAADAQAARSDELALRLVIFGGEALELSTLRPWFARHGDQQPQLINMYGITETTVHVTYRPLTSADAERASGSPIGYAIPDLQIYLLDPQMQLAPLYVPGEIYVGGPGVARGYLNQAALTAERFVPHPFTSEPGARLYRSGDLARWLPYDTLEYLGRIDEQVKVRGFRIELGEIEAALNEHPQVREAVVLANADHHGDTRLVAYVVEEPRTKNQEPGDGNNGAKEQGNNEAKEQGNNGTRATHGSGSQEEGNDADGSQFSVLGSSAGSQFSVLGSSSLREYLQARLPSYMIPALFVVLPALPLTTNGKVDRRALAEMAATAGGVRSDGHGADEQLVAPRDTLERLLAQIWETLLDVRPIGVHDNFFALGGHSLLVVRLMAEIRAQFGQDVPLAAIFQGPTIEQMAALLRQHPDGLPWSPLVPLQTGGTKAPLFCIHPAGGTAHGYVDLARSLGQDRPVYGLQSRGIEHGQQPDSTIEAMAAHYIEALREVQPEGPYHLAGWSSGGMIALEMAQQLQQQGHSIGVLAVMDTLAPLSAREFYGRMLDDADIIAALVGKQHLPMPYAEFRALTADQQFACVLKLAQQARILPPDAGPEQIQRLVDVYKANVLATAQYVPSRYAGQIVLFQAETAIHDEDALETLAEADDGDLVGEWTQLSAQPLALHRVPGSHKTMVVQPHVQVLADLLRGYLDMTYAPV